MYFADNMFASTTVLAKILFKFAILKSKINFGLEEKSFYSSEIKTASERYNIVERFNETTQLEKK